MTKLAQALVLSEKRHPGRPKKILDLRKLERVKVAKAESPAHAIETLLIFDARCLDRDTRQKLFLLLPELVHIRRAWKAEYMEHGCIGCQKKPDPTVAIAARLRRHGLKWAEVYELTGVTATSRAERKRFEGAVRWRLEHADAPGHQQSSQTYGAGGFCNRCAMRIYHRMRNRFRKAVEGRNLPAELAVFKDALCLRYNAAQRLFNGGDE